MASSKVSDLTDSGTPADADLLYVVDVSAGAPKDRKLTVANLRLATQTTTPTGGGGGSTKEKNPHSQTTDGTPQELSIDGAGERIPIPNDTTMGFVAYIVGRRTDGGAEESGFYRLEGSIKRNAGTVSMHSGIFKAAFAEDDAAWDVTFEADNVNKALVFKVTGAVGKTIAWQGWVQIVEVTG